MKTKLEILTILPKITINCEIYIHFGKLFFTKVSRKRRLTVSHISFAFLQLGTLKYPSMPNAKVIIFFVFKLY